MPDEIKLRDTTYGIDKKMLASATHVSLLIHDKDSRVVTVSNEGSMKHYLPGSKINDGETPLEAVCRIAQSQLSINFEGMERYLIPIFVNGIGYLTNNHTSLCFAVFDSVDNTLVHDCRVPPVGLMANGLIAHREKGLHLLTMSMFSLHHEYYGKLRDHIRKEPTLSSMMVNI